MFPLRWGRGGWGPRTKNEPRASRNVNPALRTSCCRLKLEVLPLSSPRTRRLNADLEIQNILFEYTGVILSQAYLACYLLMSFDVSPWQVIKGPLMGIAIGLAIDFLFNIISVFIQIHFYDIPMRNAWSNYWLRHASS